MYQRLQMPDFIIADFKKKFDNNPLTMDRHLYPLFFLSSGPTETND